MISKKFIKMSFTVRLKYSIPNIYRYYFYSRIFKSASEFRCWFENPAVKIIILKLQIWIKIFENDVSAISSMMGLVYLTNRSLELFYTKILEMHEDLYLLRESKKMVFKVKIKNLLVDLSRINLISVKFIKTLRKIGSYQYYICNSDEISTQLQIHLQRIDIFKDKILREKRKNFYFVTHFWINTEFIMHKMSCVGSKINLKAKA